MMGVENHHLANPTVKLVASQSHPWGLKVVDRSMRNRMLQSLKVILPQQTC